MKKSLIHVFLLMGIFSGLFSFQPADTVQALPSIQSEFELVGLIAYIGKDGNAWLMDSNGNNKQQLTSEGGYGKLEWAPDGKTLALMRYDNPDDLFKGQLYIKDLTESPARLLAENVTTFVWDPHGERIAYLSDHIYISSIKDIVPDVIIPEDYPYKWMFWDFSGDNLIYYYRGDIYSFNIFTKANVTIFSSNPSGSTSFEELEYSPITGHIFGWDYNSEGTGTPVLITSDNQLIDLSEETANASQPGEFNILPYTGYPSAEWSPNGNQIAYGNSWDVANGNLFLVDVEPHNLQVLPGRGINPRWSPDGRWIAFTTEKGGLQLINLETQNVIPLLSDHSNKYLYEICGFGGCYAYSTTSMNEPKWSPDGGKIIQQYKIGFYVVDVEANNKPIWVNGGISPAWQPVASGCIIDLTVEPVNYGPGNIGNPGFPISLSWRVLPIDDVINYEIRFTDAEILTDENWTDAKALNGVLSTAEKHLAFSAVVDREYRNKKLYFGLRYQLEDGRWSPLSNVVEYLDSGFRPNVDGFRFSNDKEDWGAYPAPRTLRDFTSQDFYNLFIDNDRGVSICIPGSDNGENCNLWFEYDLWILDRNLGLDIGRCFGMASTSSMIFKESLLKSNLGDNIDNVWDERVNLGVLDVRKYITKHHVLQWAYPYIDYKNEYLQKKNDRDINYAIQEIQNNISLGTSMFIVLGNNDGLHAVVPISIKKESNGTTIVFTHDNLIDKYTKVSRIELYPNGTYKHNVNVSKYSDIYFSIVPTSILQQPQSPPMSNAQKFLIQSTIKYGSMLIVNSIGARVGTDAGVFVNEIDGADVNPIIDGVDSAKFEPIYMLPTNSQYKIQFSNVPGNNDLFSISQFGVDYAIVIDNILYSNAEDDTLLISPNGNKVSYQSPAGQVLDIKITARIADAGYLYQFSKLNIENGEELQLYKDEVSNEVVLLPTSNNPFDLIVKRKDSTGETVFSFEGIQVLDARKIAFDIAGWNGRGTLTAQVDYDGDGKYDEKIRLRNEAGSNEQMLSPYNYGFIIFGAGLMLFLAGVVGLIVVRRKRLPKNR